MVGARIVRCEVFYEMRPVQRNLNMTCFIHFDDRVKSIGGSLFHSFGKRLK